MADPLHEYRMIDASRDQLITNTKGDILGLRNEVGRDMINGVSDYMSGFVGSLTAITDRQIIIPANSQAVSYGGVTITAPGSLTMGGELVTVPY